MDTSDYDGYYKDFWNAGIAFWCMHAVWSLKIWRDRNNRADRQIEVVTFEFLMTFCSICMRSWTIIWFPWIVLLSFYWFLFFKLQSVVSVLLPPSDSDFYDDFIFSVNLLFIFQLIHVLHTMYAQASAGKCISLCVCVCSRIGWASCEDDLWCVMARCCWNPCNSCLLWQCRCFLCGLGTNVEKP